jgi:ABA4-like protein
MTPERLFSVLNLVAVVGWLPLIFLPRVRWARTVVPLAIPIVLAVIYSGIVVTTFAGTEGGFSSLADVSKLFENPWALLAGWTHYLAFDLFIGGWEVRDAHDRGVPHLFIVPALVLTFLFGPAGLLVYLAIRALRRTAFTKS